MLLRHRIFPTASIARINRAISTGISEADAIQVESERLEWVLRAVPETEPEELTFNPYPAPHKRRETAEVA